MAQAPPDPSRGVFETLLVRDGRVQALDAHVERLTASITELYGLDLPAGFRATLAQRAATLTGEHRLRVDATPEAGGPRIEFQTSPLPPDRVGRAPLVCRPVVVPGGLGRHKWCDRRRLDALGALVALGDARVVALLVDRGGDLLEAAWANLWLLEHAPGATGTTRLVTPPPDGRLLPGVTRAMLLELAPELGLEARQEPISLARARAAPGIFLTSSLRLAVPATLETLEAPHRPSTTDYPSTFEAPDHAAMARADSGLKAIRAALSRRGWD